jgi:Transglutaminase-like superfamily
VLLDVKRDVYLGVSECEGHAIASHIHGWSDLLSEHSLAPGSDSTPVLEEMISTGMLTSEAHVGKAAVRAPACIPADSSLSSEYSEACPKISPSDALSFCKAVAIAAHLLRNGLEPAVNRVVQRRRLNDALDPSDDADVSHVIELIRLRTDIFARLRPFLFTSRNNCLFEALAMSEFLADCGIYPRWIFGVTTDPFAAHCWLQQGNVAITDAVENTSRYTPIMVI